MSGMIDIFCKCGNRMVVFPHHAGTTMDCPKCGEPNDVPVDEDAPPKGAPRPVHVPSDSWLERLFAWIRGD